ncbi:hypothetical protein FORC53_5580 [Vibrio vulnificus]|uniref:Uncharacterized protein n=2 Tax=Vibrio vulnificus TaxID=672 RepID=A0AAN1PWD2_VIBVL|nr:hypothetical protein FORC53_5580 [Vibrio vulnificus]
MERVMVKHQQTEKLLGLCERIFKETKQPHWLIYSTFRPELIDPLGESLEAEMLNTMDAVKAYLNMRLERYDPEHGIFVDIACQHTGSRETEGIEWVHVGFEHDSTDLVIQREEHLTDDKYRISDYTPEKFHEVVALLSNDCFPYKEKFSSWHEGGFHYKPTNIILSLFSKPEEVEPNFLAFLLHMLEFCESNQPIDAKHNGDYNLWSSAIIGETLNVLTKNGFKTGDKSSIDGNPLLTAVWNIQDISAEILMRETERRNKTGHIAHPNDLNNEFLGQLRLIYNHLVS